jgi:hypothetical protein
MRFYTGEEVTPDSRFFSVEVDLVWFLLAKLYATPRFLPNTSVAKVDF